MSANFYELLKYAATGIASPSMTYYDKLRASTLMGGVVQTLTGIPPLTFKADGTPLISWSMKGNGSQQGTPTPDNPVMPTFCGVRTGNLHDPETDAFGIIDPNGNISSSSVTKSTDFIPCESGSQYVLRVYKTSTLQSTNQRTVDFYASDKSYIDVGWDNRVKYTLNGDEEYLDIPFIVPTGARFLRFCYDIGYNKSMLNLGSTALPYEPFGWAEKITNAGQTVPVYLGEVPTVRRVRKLVLTGEENISLYTYLNRRGIVVSNILDTNYTRAEGICTHYPVFSGSMSANVLWIGVNDRALYFIAILDILGYTTVDEFKSYLASEYAAGHPVTVWYILATPITGIVNEPLCKIGDYADTLTTTTPIPTAKGSNTLSVDTTVQPSEVSITGNIKPTT